MVTHGCHTTNSTENGTSVTKMSVPVTAEEKTNKKNDVKARSLLLVALPNEYQLTFSLEIVIGRLAHFLGVVISQEGLNSKFEQLAPEWNIVRKGKKIFINANDTAGYDKSKVECFNCHKMGHFAKECRAARSKEGQFRNQDNTRKQGNNEDTSSKAMLAIDGVDDSKENSDDSLVKEQVSKDTSSFVESSLFVLKKTIFPIDKKAEFVKPKNHEKPVKKSVRLVPSCFVILILEPLALSFNFVLRPRILNRYPIFLIFEHETCGMNSTPAGMRHYQHSNFMYPEIKQLAIKRRGRNMAFVDSKNLLDRVSAQSVGLLNTDCIRIYQALLVLITERLKRTTHLIHIESRKSPTAVLFDVDTGRISIRHVNTKESHSDVLARSQG
ncbi:putative ribonuclease H-like domain-containing protein [Tanacetum coccineum]